MKAIIYNDTSFEGHIACQQLIATLKVLCYSSGIEILSLYERHKVDKQNEQLSEDLEQADIIIINGEGTFHRSPSIALKMLTTNNNLPIYLINTLWEKMFIPQKYLKNVVQVWTRESFSYKNARCYFLDKKVKLVPDLLFAADIDVPKVGYSDSVLEVPREFLGCQRNFYPMNIRANMSDFYSRCAWMKSLDLLVTGRFHDVVMASMLNVPFLVIPSNSHKIEALLQDMGCNDLLCIKYKDIESKQEKATKLIDRANKYAVQAKKTIQRQFENTFILGDDYDRSDSSYEE